MSRLVQGTIIIFYFFFVSSLSSNAQPTQWIVPSTCAVSEEVQALPSLLRGMWRMNRERLVGLSKPTLGDPSIIFLSGDKEQARYPFRQNSNFLYVSGVNMPGTFISINTTNTWTTLFVPAPSADYAVWNGHVYTKSQLLVMYDVDEVLYTNETTLFASHLPSSTTVYTIESSVSLPSPILQFTINSKVLGNIMTSSRATKSNKEITLMTLVNKISSLAHVATMQFVASRLNTTHTHTPLYPNPPFFPHQIPARSTHASISDLSSLHLPFDDVARQALEELNFFLYDDQTLPPSTKYDKPAALFEYQAQSTFQFVCGLCGALQQSYLPIVGAGNNGAILHYIANDAPIVDGELLLIDAGGEFWGYGSDITSTYPVNGVFTDEQRLIYTIVLATQADVVNSVRNGVTWVTLNNVARESITRRLLDAGFLIGNFNELMSNGVCNVFYPHGIGHSVGLDVHDSQTATIYTNQVITVEPGVYFNSYLLDQARVGTRARFIAWDLVDQFRGTGGVRIEDDFVVTETGSLKITHVPRDIQEIEKIMKAV